MTKTRSGIIILIIFVSSVHAQTRISQESYVLFKIKTWKIFTKKGLIGGMRGSIQFYPDDPDNSRFDVCIDPGTVDTGNKKEDKHIKSADFLDIDRYPSICITSENIIKKDDQYEFIGNLTLHGVTREVVMPFTSKDQTFKGTIEINRLDYGIASKMGLFKADDKIVIEINCMME